MSLDQNLFTLLFTPSKDDPNVTDLVDPSENPHYRKERVIGETYRINVYDPLSQSLLASATAPHATSKHKTIELHNPSKTVELKYTGTLTFKWRFQWEEHEFEWKREECFIIRKPDPAVLVAITKEAAGRLKTSSVQILDYNLNRFDIQDRKGLEIVILTALLTFQDSNDAYHTPNPNLTSTSDGTPTVVTTADLSSTRPVPPLHTRPSFFGISRRGSDEKRATAALTTQLGELQLTPDAPPALPPKPAPRTGMERIAEMHAVRVASGEGEANEVVVDNEGSVEEYARYVEGMLKDSAILFVTIRSANATEVPKVLQVVEETKRRRYKSGIDEDEPLHQYVVYDTAQAKRKGPKRINLDDPNSSTSTSKAYAPPTSLSIHLSKIDMPELQPRPEPKVERRSPAHQPQPTTPLDKFGYPDSKSEMLAWEREQGRSKMSGRQREKEREKEKAKEREREKDTEKAKKKAEKEVKKAAKGKKGSHSGTLEPQPNHSTKPITPTPILSHTVQLQTNIPQYASSSYTPPVNLSSYPTELQHSSSFSFPQPGARPVSTFYDSSGFMTSPSSLSPPPLHPSLSRARPASWYSPDTGINTYGSGSVPGYGYDPNYLRQ